MLGGGVQRRFARCVAGTDGLDPATTFQCLQYLCGNGHAADILDITAGHRLAISDDGQCLHHGTRIARWPLRVQTIKEFLHLGTGAETPAAGDAGQFDAAVGVFLEERIEHLSALREAQDETGGFLTFIPLAFHPKNTQMADLSRSSGIEDLKNIAVARCFLDNFPHIKAYWVMIGIKLAQVGLSFGADDIDGTVKEEIITHMAGGDSEQAQARQQLVRIIREAGRLPIERDTLFNVLHTY